jgi:hypothetical protein
MNYPIEMIAGAADAAKTVLELIERNNPPFDGRVTKQWIERARDIAPG